jgi:type II secretory pathway predicted ATPase ExeA
VENREIKYFEKLGMQKEPFATDADQGFFYPIPEQMGCIRRLQTSLRMNGGLNLILGEPGVGKTMLAKITGEHFAAREESFVFRSIPELHIRSEYQFLKMLWDTFEIETPCRSTIEYRNAIDDFLFRQMIEEGKRIVLIVDEGHELKRPGIKVLMDLLDYRFDRSRLFHLVIFGRIELLERIRKWRRFEELINLVYTINPLDLDEMKEVIHHRLKVAGCRNSNELFDDLALHEVWRFSGGNPLKAIVMCYHSLMSMTMRDNSIVGPETVISVARNWRAQP